MAAEPLAKRAPPQPSKDDVTARLIAVFKRLIAEEELSPGRKLPPERDLAGTLGVSRSSLRQALKVLEIMGVISQRVGDGTYLNAAAPSILSEPMEFLILLDGITFHELMEARLIVEPALAARAAERATPDDIRELTTVHDEMEEAKANPRKFVEADLHFHQTLFRIAGNRVCNMMFTVVHQSVHKLMLMTSRLVDAEHTLILHRRILAAIRRGDAAGAGQEMIGHLEDATGLLSKVAQLEKDKQLLNRLGKFAERPEGRSVKGRPSRQ